MKKIITFFLAIGAYHLFIYCSTNKIPISIDLIATTSTLLIFGIATTMTAIMIGLTPCLLLAVTSSAQDSPLYQKCFNAEKTESPLNPTIKSAFLNYLYLFSSTFILFMAYIWNYDVLKNYISTGNFFLILIAESLITTLIAGKFLLKKHKNFILNNFTEGKATSKTYLTIMAIKTSWFFSLFFALLWATIIFQIKNEIALIISIILLILINGIFLIPTKKQNSFHEIASKYSPKKSIEKLADSIYAPSLLLLLFILGLILFHPLIIERTSSATLKMLKIGGDIERTYHFSSSIRSEIPSEIIESCKEEENCRTTKVKVIFDIGNILYVKGHASEIYALPREKLWPIID